MKIQSLTIAIILGSSPLYALAAEQEPETDPSIWYQDLPYWAQQRVLKQDQNEPSEIRLEAPKKTIHFDQTLKELKLKRLGADLGGGAVEDGAGAFLHSTVEVDPKVLRKVLSKAQKLDFDLQLRLASQEDDVNGSVGLRSEFTPFRYTAKNGSIEFPIKLDGFYKIKNPDGSRIWINPGAAVVIAEETGSKSNHLIRLRFPGLVGGMMPQASRTDGKSEWFGGVNAGIDLEKQGPLSKKLGYRIALTADIITRILGNPGGAGQANAEALFLYHLQNDLRIYGGAKGDLTIPWAGDSQPFRDSTTPSYTAGVAAGVEFFQPR